MERRVVITGLGAITPIGNNTEEFWKGIKEGKCGIDEITHFDITDYKVKLAAEVKGYNAEEYFDRRTAKRMDKFSQYVTNVDTYANSMGAKSGAIKTTTGNTSEHLINLANGIRIVTGVILLLLIIISIFIIANTIKLTVHARRKEISIMKYVGATNNFIRWPFIVEGMIIGIFASIISIVIVGGAYNFIAQELVNVSFIKLIGMSLVGFNEMLSSIIVVYMLLGIGIGAIGSVVSMRKYLKV